MAIEIAIRQPTVFGSAARIEWRRAVIAARDATAPPLQEALFAARAFSIGRAVGRYATIDGARTRATPTGAAIAVDEAVLSHAVSENNLVPSVVDRRIGVRVIGRMSVAPTVGSDRGTGHIARRRAAVGEAAGDE